MGKPQDRTCTRKQCINCSVTKTLLKLLAQFSFYSLFHGLMKLIFLLWNTTSKVLFLISKIWQINKDTDSLIDGEESGSENHKLPSSLTERKKLHVLYWSRFKTNCFVLAYLCSARARALLTCLSDCWMNGLVVPPPQPPYPSIHQCCDSEWQCVSLDTITIY